jgi:small subunit ribosomal protein S6
MATPITMQSYELMLIFTPVLAEDEFKSAQQKFMDLITSNGGEIVSSEPWGLRTLAYPIQKKTTGLYWVVEYKAPSDVNAKIETQLGREETIMRQMFTRLDKHAIAYNDRKRNGIKLQHTPKNANQEVEEEA